MTSWHPGNSMYCLQTSDLWWRRRTRMSSLLFYMSLQTWDRTTNQKQRGQTSSWPIAILLSLIAINCAFSRLLSKARLKQSSPDKCRQWFLRKHFYYQLHRLEAWAALWLRHDRKAQDSFCFEQKTGGCVGGDPQRELEWHLFSTLIFLQKT